MYCARVLPTELLSVHPMKLSLQSTPEHMSSYMGFLIQSTPFFQALQAEHQEAQVRDAKGKPLLAGASCSWLPVRG